MALQGCGANTAKIFLFIFNLCLWICGCVLIGLGTYVTIKQDDFKELFAEDTVFVASWITIAVGCFIFLISFCGCCGAKKESTCLLKTYFAFILFIILLEIAAGILAFVFRDDIENSLMKGMTNTIHNTYGNKSGATEAVDDVQKTFDCCGATNYTDYAEAKYLKPGQAVPESCCRSGQNATVCVMGTKGNPLDPSKVWSDGCVSSSLGAIKDKYWIIGLVALGVIIFEILTMIFACCIINGIVKGYEYV